MTKEPFLKDLYDSLNDTPMQQKFRNLRPWPAGVVFIEWPGMSDDDIRSEFRLMKKLGFNALKQVQVEPSTDRRKVMHIALDEGIIPWWYGEAGWEAPTPELLGKLQIPVDIAPEKLRENRIWLDRQERIMRERIEKESMQSDPPFDLDAAKRDKAELPGVVKRFEYGLGAGFAEPFTSWLKARYTTVDNLKKAWHFGLTMVNYRKWETWTDVQNEVIDLVNLEGKEYARIKDCIRFKTSLLLEEIKQRALAQMESDQNAPFRAGGEISLFLPMPSICIDMEAIADMMAEVGSFYPSIHISWHFEEVEYEFAKPVYMMSSLAADLFKGGWAATWESTGGPQILTGAKAQLYDKMRNEPAGATIDGGAIKQLILSYMAGGFKGFGLWSFEPRITGWEGGEYGLLDTDCQVTDRALAAGAIGKACQDYRDELWQCRKEPVVGILTDWENDALWCAVALRGRKIYEHFPVFARIGSARTFIDHNIPFEHVTPQNIRKGLCARYEVLYLPAFLGLDSTLFPILRDYVEQGGRLVIDAPGGWYDIDGSVLVTANETPFEQLFGARLANFQYARSTGRPWSLDGRRLKGFVTDLVPTSAKVVKCFDDGKPAVTEHFLGKGSAVIIGYGVSLSCHMPDQSHDEALLARWVLGDKQPPYRCENCTVYRICSPDADHYFLLNDGPETKASLQTERCYHRACDPLTGESVSLNDPIAVEGYSARWIRAEKRTHI